MDPNKELADLKAANADLANQVTELNAKLAAANQADAIKAKDAEIAALKAQVEALNGKLADQAKANAKTVVDAAVQDGKLPPQNTDLQVKWIEAISANPALAETLNALSPNPALSGAITGASGAKTIEPRIDEAERKIAEFRLQAKCSYEEARNIVRAREPALFGLSR